MYKWRTKREPDFVGYRTIGTTTYTEPVTAMGSYHQATQSFGHDFPHGLRKDSRGFRDIGGSFNTTRVDIDLFGDSSFRPIRLSNTDNLSLGTRREKFGVIVPSSYVAQMINLTNTDYTGPLRSSYYQDLRGYNAITRAVPNSASDSDLLAAGTTAISRVLPTNPLVDLSTSISETISARKLFSVPGKSGSVSGEYLNLQLGILPVVSDVQDTYRAAVNSERVIRQYEKDSGKLVRRRYQFPDQKSSSTSQSGKVHPGCIGFAPDVYLIETGIVNTYTSKSARTWFSGAFTYYLPKNSWRKRLAHYERLYGIVPGSETAWNVIPYSFVADYFANTGDVLHNVDRFVKDGLVMPYGYIMREEITTRTDTITTRVNLGGVWTQKTFGATVTTTSKRRIAATPFGFGLTLGDLSTRQISILAALGLNRK